MREIRETQTPGRSLKGKRDRRAFLAAAAGAAAGATAATLLPETAKRAEAAPDGPLIIGQHNEGNGQVTSLSAELETVVGGPNEPASTLALDNRAASLSPDERARALIASSFGESIFGITFGDPAQGGAPVGVRGHSSLPGGGYGSATGVHGRSGSGPGVAGQSESGPGVAASSQSGPGVRGDSESGPGVEGHSEGMAGVWGTGRLIGVLGWTREGGTAGVAGQAPGEIPGVIAHTQAPGGPMPPDGGVALLVTGRARFATAGAGTVPARASTATVSNAAVRADSHVTVTFTGDPGGASVGWVERQPDTGFIVHLSGRARWPVPFTYLIVEPGT